ncbi:efflux transporter periplasmic adaptor subunit [Ectothiorhodospira shaposhnikovii]|uniref:efflux RND transporter periplasmic adaptor subunit n=1 Tax=Ectothiorhodospira shaposhnikovii TaxID=1054 RepID=UPI001903F4F8|nr:efflux RND transporter periplasmic adaptor subunit [Ectothiorhodospira shaposhnikovii]MBK1671974.1 efflux transporter periplasmic adaptor subunit [Ectothiorhodospira shaposhnikovii]
MSTPSHTRRALPAAGLIATLFAAFWLSACGSGDEAAGPGAGGMPPPPVTLSTLAAEDVKVRGDYAGRVRGSREVEVRARVDGILEQRLYVEGQAVGQGAPLFRIDPEPYEIALKMAEAEQANAQAGLNQAEREWNRISDLYQRNVVSTRDRDQALSELELTRARLDLARASVADAQRNLRYTTVVAPIEGTTDLESLPEGSLISQGTLLTSLTQHNPVHVRFSLPEQDAAIQRTARQAMMGREEIQSHEVQLLLPDGSQYEHMGQVDFTDSSIDPRTGTVSARAVFPNPDRLVVPGQFVRVRIMVQELKDVFLIDPTAVSQDRDGPRVFLVDNEDTAHARHVRLGPLVDGRQVILDGLSAGERLVINGHVGLRDGMKVSPVNAQGRDQ